MKWTLEGRGRQWPAVALALSILASCSRAQELAELPPDKLTSNYDIESVLLISRILDGTPVSPLPELGLALEEDWKSEMGILNTGRPVRAQAYPWHIGLLINYGPERKWRCGGILISPSYILTAAHCLDQNPASNRQRLPVDVGVVEVFQGHDIFAAPTPLRLDPAWPVSFHPGWKENATDPDNAWDAALLKLAQPLTNATPAPVRTVAFVEGDAVTSGFGNYNAAGDPSSELRAVKVPVVGNDTCRENLPQNYAARVGSFTLCAASRTADACKRDSGSPLVIGTTQRPQTIGIVSWGLSTRCGVPGPGGVLIGAYTRASEIAPWILFATQQSETLTNENPGQLFEIEPRNDMFILE